jgi:hypothetical protein
MSASNFMPTLSAGAHEARTANDLLRDGDHGCAR